MVLLSEVVDQIKSLTWIVILTVISMGFPVYAQDQDVLRAQRSLAIAGYDPGPLDGYWGGLTASALSDFIADFNIGIRDRI